MSRKLLLIAGLLLAGSRAVAQPCPCPKYDLEAIVNQADVIFVGKVLSATTDAAAPRQLEGGTWSGEGAGDSQTRVMIDVSAVLKGNPPRLVEVVTPAGPCGFVFFVGKTYLVTAVGNGTPVATDVCHGNVAGNAIEFRRTLIEDVLHPKP